MIDIKSMIEANRNGEAKGLPCFCTANEHVIRAILQDAARTGLPTVIEATCNQVNQDGGYTGMTPADYFSWIGEMAAEAGVPMDQIIMGGDHLGPNPWRKEAADTAMEKARELVRLYVSAGFRKIHLDASMQLGGEPPLSFAQIAERAADLCTVAEEHAPDPDKLVYIIGTEVPIPGGETKEPDALDVTSVPRFKDTIETHREAFAKRGLDAAWSRIVSVVTQPGVDFGHTSVFTFDPAPAKPLAEAILTEPAISYEAHSTDYQPTEALAQLVENHFFFLKVGPELTFRFREAVFALAEIEAQIAPEKPSGLKSIVKRRMAENDGYWRDYYHGSESETALLRIFSYSDRIRYYWTDPEIAEALDTLIANLKGAEVSETIVSQYFTGLEFGGMPTDPDALISGHVQRCVQRYNEAAGLV
ncbi:class II D-tagatose-bisphosphate aldolase, non-catalytic subunit [Marinovum sp.]|uniref:class II D-tagatose-bisphosphate aldolase, non-catalytic subunit n=1 Tax=Marinovum sp. TaxID=2024839 RepID=UPI002B2788D4|nr:class II D-tagatose-bisphosphate aldolase, non-catalytic subunit [Marinovum sp.]